MSKQKLRVGVIGAGFGGLAHVPSFNMCPGAKVAAVWSRNPEKAQELTATHNIERVVHDYREILDMEDVNLVTVATPPHTHRDIVLHAAEAGKHVLCEKPLATSAKQAREMAEAVGNAGVLGAVAHQMRFQPTRMSVKNVIEGGALGRILHVNLAYDTSNRIERNKPWSWWSDLSAGGGQLSAMGSHQIDLLRWWFGEVRSVFGHTGTAFPVRPDRKTGEMLPVTADEFAQFVMEFASGVSASVSLSSVAIGWKTSSIQIYGEKGALFVDGEEKLTMFRKTTAAHDLTTKDPLLGVPWISGSIWLASFARLAEALIAAIRKGQAYRGATFHDGVKNQEIIDAVRLSSNKGCRVNLDELY